MLASLAADSGKQRIGGWWVSVVRRHASAARAQAMRKGWQDAICIAQRGKRSMLRRSRFTGIAYSYDAQCHRRNRRRGRCLSFDHMASQSTVEALVHRQQVAPTATTVLKVATRRTAGCLDGYRNRVFCIGDHRMAAAGCWLVGFSRWPGVSRCSGSAGGRRLQRGTSLTLSQQGGSLGCRICGVSFRWKEGIACHEETHSELGPATENVRRKAGPRDVTLYFGEKECQCLGHARGDGCRNWQIGRQTHASPGGSESG